MVPFNRAELFTNLNVSLPAPPTRRVIPLNEPIEVPAEVEIFPLFVPEITILEVWLASDWTVIVVFDPDPTMLPITAPGAIVRFKSLPVILPALARFNPVFDPTAPMLTRLPFPRLAIIV